MPKKSSGKPPAHVPPTVKQRSHPLVAKLKDDAHAGTVRLIGYPHNDASATADAAANPGNAYVHIFPSLGDLSFHYRVKEDDIVHEEPPTDPAGEGPTTFHLKANAQVIQAKTASAVEQARLLAGAVTQKFTFADGVAERLVLFGKSTIIKCTNVPHSGNGPACGHLPGSAVWCAPN